MSLLRITRSKEMPKILKAKESIPMLIWQKNFPTGKIDIPLAHSAENPMASLVLWYTMDPAGARTLSCGGEEVNLALPSGDYFD